MEFPKRKKNRLEDYNYSENGAYFITICVKDRREILWDVEASIVERDGVYCASALSKFGAIVDAAVLGIPEHYSCVFVDKYVIMPNHIHMILTILKEDGRPMGAPTIATVVNQVKGYATKQMGFSPWQKLYHDRIIRNEQEYKKICDYIDTNPWKWEEDCFYVP